MRCYHIQIDYRIAAAMLNFTHKPILPDKNKAKQIANLMKSRCKIKINILDFLLNKTVGTKSIFLINNDDVQDFPRFKSKELTNNIALGTFQFKLVKSYLKDIINHGYPYGVSKSLLVEIKNKKQRDELSRKNRKIIAMEILPRHGRSSKLCMEDKAGLSDKNNKQKVYKAFVLYEPNNNNVTGIKGMPLKLIIFIRNIMLFLFFLRIYMLLLLRSKNKWMLCACSFNYLLFFQFYS